ncbi:MAG: alpha/beta fold hydrolase [Leptolyngbyaceae bacterium]|nr:alpha/beta fold hydrolase [Leptolyngbyaceae bacterium]
MQTLTAPSAPLPGAYWSWRDQPIYYVRAGQPQPDRPPILLVHGFGASTDHWRKNIHGLQQDFDVWAIDLLGFGRSAKPAWEYSGSLWRDQLHAFIQEQIGQPVVLAGNSLGGYAALCVAAQCPTSAAGLALLNSAGPFTTADTSQVDPVRTLLGNITQFFFAQTWASFLLFKYVQQKSVIRKTLEKVYLDQSAITEQLIEEIYRPSCDPGAPQVFASVFKSPSGDKVDTLLQQLLCPLLMLWGEADPWMNAKERSMKFRQHYPQLTEHFLQAGHCPHDEVPDQVNELIRNWMLSISTKPGSLQLS